MARSLKTKAVLLYLWRIPPLFRLSHKLMTAVLTAVTLLASAVSILAQADGFTLRTFHYQIVQLGGGNSIDDQRLPIALNPDSRSWTRGIFSTLQQAATTS
jgi:hypothetical protein